MNFSLKRCKPPRESKERFNVDRLRRPIPVDRQMEHLYEEIPIRQCSITVPNPNRHSLADSAIYTLPNPHGRKMPDYVNVVYADLQEVANGEPTYAKINKLNKKCLE